MRCTGHNTYRKPHREEKSLRVLVLERLQQGPQTSDDIFQAFPEFGYNTLRTAISQIRAMGHNVSACPIRRTRSNTFCWRYTLLPAKKIEIR